MSAVFNDSFLDALELSAQTKPCGFDPKQFLSREQNENGTDSSFLGADYKSLWLQVWAKENNVTAYCIDDKPAISVFGDTALVMVTSHVVVDGKEVAASTAGKGCYLNNLSQLDCVVQAAASIARGRALSNAGFGPIWRTTVDREYPMPSQDGTPMQAAEPYNDPAGDFIPGMIPPAPVSASTPNPGFVSGSVPDSAISTVPGAAAGMSKQREPKVPSTPEEAKRVIYTFNSPLKGKTLGEVLAADPRSIVWLATKCSNTTLGQAANLLLQEANRIMGKA